MVSYDDHMTTRTVQATTFKATCLSLLDEVADTGDELIVTKRGKPVARISPIAGPERIAGSVTLLSEVDDDFFSTGEVWDADT